MTADEKMDGQTEILYGNWGNFTPWPAAVCGMHNYSPHEWSPKIEVDDRIERQRKIDRDPYRHRDRHISSIGTHKGPPDTSVGINPQIRSLSKFIWCWEGWLSTLFEKKCSPRTTSKELLLLLLHQMPPTHPLGNDPSRFIIGGTTQGEAMVHYYQ